MDPGRSPESLNGMKETGSKGSEKRTTEAPTISVPSCAGRDADCGRACSERWPGLIAILLTGGEAHDCPVAERLIITDDNAGWPSATYAHQVC
jgi:hypothetical protein